MHLDVDIVDVDGADVLAELLDVDELVDILDVVVVRVVLVGRDIVDLVDVIDEVLCLDRVDVELLVVLLVLLQVVVQDVGSCGEVLDDRGVDVPIVI